MASVDNVKCFCSNNVSPTELRNHFLIYHFGCREENLPGEFYCKMRNCRFHANNASEIVEHCVLESHDPKQVLHSEDIFQNHVMELTARVMELNNGGGASGKKRRGRKPEKVQKRPSPATRCYQSPSADNFLLSEITIETPAIIQLDGQRRRSSSGEKRKRLVVDQEVGRRNQERAGSFPSLSEAGVQQALIPVKHEIDDDAEIVPRKKGKRTPKSREQERPFRCSLCNFAPKMRNVRELSALRSHARLHLKPLFECVLQPECDFRSNNPSSVRTHIDITHNMKRDPVCQVDAETYKRNLDEIAHECFGDF